MKSISDYTIYCTPEQTKKALELGTPIPNHKLDNHYAENLPKLWFYKDGNCYQKTTAEQMIGWLRSKGMKFYFNDITTLWQVVCNHKIIGQGCSENKELAAIDIALEYLSNNHDKI